MSERVKTLVSSGGFTLFIVFLILANSITLATEHYEQEPWLTDFQNIANLVFTFLFALEMVLNMIGLGIKDYFKDGFNIFDAIIVVASLVDLGVTLTTEENSGGFITVLRGFRLLRIFKLVKSWTTLQQLLKTIIDSITATANLAVLALLFMFVYSLVGKQFFYGEMIDEDGVVSRYHFNSTPDSMITMFIVLSGENWNYVMSTVALAHPDKQLLAIFFFVSAMIIGNFMLLNLFLAILLKFLQDAVEEINEVAKKEKELKKQKMLEAQRQAVEIEK